MKLLLDSESVAKALRLATEAHRGQVDKAGRDYINHPVAVAERLDTAEAQTAALLHDVVEDTAVTLNDLRSEGFSERVVSAVEHLTHREGEPREDYIARIAENPLAVTVKLADLAHNSDLGRLPEVSEKDLQRVERYKRETELLTRVKAELLSKGLL